MSQSASRQSHQYHTTALIADDTPLTTVGSIGSGRDAMEGGRLVVRDSSTCRDSESVDDLKASLWLLGHVDCGDAYCRCVG